MTAARAAERSIGGWPWRITWRLLWYFVHWTVRLLWVRRYVGREHLPAGGAYILAANHASFLDPVVAGIGCWRRVRFLARKTLLQRRDGSVNERKALLADLFHVIPIDRDRGGRGGLRGGLACLAAGNVLMLFPEGTRSTDGEIGEFKSGVGLIALKSGVPVVPVCIDATDRAWPRGRNRPLIPKRVVTVSYGEPVTYAKPTKADEVAHDLMSRVLDLRRAAANDDAAGRADDGDGPSTGGAAE